MSKQDRDTKFAIWTLRVAFVPFAIISVWFAILFQQWAIIPLIVIIGALGFVLSYTLLKIIDYK